MNELLFDLPWQIQVSLASGYAAYLIAYTGIRVGHRAIDTMFATLAFGVVATAVLAVCAEANPFISGGAAIVATIAIAVLWRRFFRGWFYTLLRWWNISWANDDPTALATLSANTKYKATQIAVELDNGTWLRCDDTSRFHKAPFAPFILGPNGDVAFYLTHEERPNEEATEVGHVQDDNYGARITYIPASRIRQITLRHRR